MSGRRNGQSDGLTDGWTYCKAHVGTVSHFENRKRERADTRWWGALTGEGMRVAHCVHSLVW